MPSPQEVIASVQRGEFDAQLAAFQSEIVRRQQLLTLQKGHSFRNGDKVVFNGKTRPRYLVGLTTYRCRDHARRYRDRPRRQSGHGMVRAGRRPSGQVPRPKDPRPVLHHRPSGMSLTKYQRPDYAEAHFTNIQRAMLAEIIKRSFTVYKTTRYSGVLVRPYYRRRPKTRR